MQGALYVHTYRLVCVKRVFKKACYYEMKSFFMVTQSKYSLYHKWFWNMILFYCTVPLLIQQYFFTVLSFMYWPSKPTCNRRSQFTVRLSARQSDSESVWGLEPEPEELSIVYGSGRAIERGEETSALL